MGPTPGAFLNLFKELCESSVIAQTYMQMSDGNLNANDLFILVMLQFLDRFSLCSPTPPLQVLSLGRGGQCFGVDNFVPGHMVIHDFVGSTLIGRKTRTKLYILHFPIGSNLLARYMRRVLHGPRVKVWKHAIKLTAD